MGQGLRLLSEELKQFSKPYYWVNMVLCLSFIFCKLVDPICSTLFSHYGIEACELDMRENEILFFLLIIIMIRSRKTGSLTMVSYLSSGFVYAKVANLVLFFRADPRLGLVYLLLFILQGMLLPEPTYKGPENLVYFRANGLDDELQRDPHVTWLVAFFAPWSPSCINFTPIFSKLSGKYHLPNLKFGKIDVGRYPDVGTKYHINTTALTRQLPTLILFENGKESGRVPAIISGKVQKFVFKEEDIVSVFDLNNLYNTCKSDKKFAAKIKEQEKAEKADKVESKKDK